MGFPSRLMALARNQITDIFIWVHPECLPIADDVAKKCELFIEALATEPHAAVIESPCYERPRYYDGLTARLGLSNSGFPEYWETVQRHERLETRALNLLGDRFIIWPFSGGIMQDDPEHIDYIKKTLNVTPRNFNPIHEDKKHLFRRLDVFGELPHGCVSHHIPYVLGLAYELATILPSNEPFFPNDSMPSNNETLETLARLSEEWRNPQRLGMWMQRFQETQ